LKGSKNPVLDGMDARFPSTLRLKKLLSHAGDNETINGQEDIKWKTKKQGESDKADKCPEGNLPALDGGEAVKKVREKD
jgi:hypothetical protein